jgi:hypothetical protein
VGGLDEAVRARLSVLAERRSEALDRRGGSDLSGGRSAHPVCDGEKGVGDEQAILVVAPDEPYVGCRSGPQLDHL